MALCEKRQKRRTEILWVLEKNPRLSLRGGQAVLRKKGLKISCDTIRRRLLAHEVKFRSTIGQKKFWTAIDETRQFFRTKVLFGHVLSFIIPALSTPIDSSSGLLKES